MHRQFRNPNFYVLVLADMAMFVAAIFLAYGVRFSLEIPPDEYGKIIRLLPWLVAVKTVTFFLMGAYRGMWRYTSLLDIQRLLLASAVSSALLIAGVSLALRLEGYPRSVFVADGIFTFFFCACLRAAIRMNSARYARRGGNGEAATGRPPNPVKVLLIGAGDAADKLIREVLGNPRAPYEIVCCLDDDTAKQHRSLHGLPVRGPIAHLSRFATQFSAHEILIAMPSVSGERMREIVAVCEKAGLPFKTLPSLTALLNGHVTLNDLRPVNFEDLLGRPAVKLDGEIIGAYLTGKTIAVTGAGGSIGSELCRQIIRFNPAALILIEGSEFNLYRMEMEVRTELKFPRVFPAMGRVQDRPLMERIFASYRPQVVFHAAACKHVPLVEMNPWEGIFNNVLGSQIVMEVAEQHGVERCVLISTDKAVRPTNVMGASKRAAEILLQSRPPNGTRFMAVRFGNVVGSSGSAIPLFQSQIKAGGPVTVTHPEMTRYFMTIPEACQLVLQAASLGDGGEIFILEMGTPVKIADMARDIIRLSGKEPDTDIKIVYTGLRPGEKLYEELITDGEGIAETVHDKIKVLRRNGEATQRTEALAMLEDLVRKAAVHDAPGIKATLERYIPEYVPSDSGSVLCAATRAGIDEDVTVHMEITSNA
jgi:FlaA1/EpsC-like NDP-sugar epimerase